MLVMIGLLSFTCYVLIADKPAVQELIPARQDLNAATAHYCAMVTAEYAQGFDDPEDAARLSAEYYSQCMDFDRNSAWVSPF